MEVMNVGLLGRVQADLFCVIGCVILHYSLNSFSFVNLRETMKLSLNYPGHLYRSVPSRYWLVSATPCVHFTQNVMNNVTRIGYSSLHYNR